MKRALLLLTLVSIFGPISAQKGAWSRVNAEQVADASKIRSSAYSPSQQLFQLNEVSFRSILCNVAEKFSGQNGTEVTIPNINGQLEKFLVWENSNFASELQAQYPEIRAYSGRGVTDKTATLSFSMSQLGLQTMVLRGDRSAEFIESYTTDRSVYVLFDSKNRIKGTLPFECATPNDQLSQMVLNRSEETALANNGVYKTMRLALSVTGEYTAYFGGTVGNAMAAINASMTRVNAINEMDLALHLNLIPNNNVLVYTSAFSDPYSPSAQMGNWNNELQTTLTSVIGEANYDIGHLFGATGGGGNAGCIGCVCGPGKGSAYTSPADGIPMGDNFDVDYVAHEIGHQLGANHTFSMSGENNSVNVEPGSGSTIMAYAGITGATDVQPHSDPYFTYRSILQIQNNLATKTCPITTTMTNQTPIVNAGSDWTIPVGTPFVLTGSGSDPNGDTLTFCWEQNDDAVNVGASASYPSGTKTDGPNFRSLTPTNVPVRYMPNFETVLNGATSNAWEAVSTVGRTLNFTLTARDNFPGGGQTQTDGTIVTVSSAAGPFTVTSQNTAGTSWAQGSTQTVSWTVNNTNTLPGSSNVNIRMSTDGGVTFGTVLAANVPNDGSENITVPNVAAINCRLLIEPTGNIFYAVNSTPFAVGYIITTTCNTYSNATPLVIPDGAGANTPGAAVSSSISVPDTGTISDVDIALNVTHSYPNDLVINITHPDGTVVPVWNRACAGNDNFNIIVSDGSPAFTCAAGMTGTYAPSSPLSAFNNKPANGSWSLSVSDFWNVDTGSLNSWSISVCTAVAELATPEIGLTDFAVYPNPSNGEFNVQFSSNTASGVSVMVHDMRGRAIFGNDYSGAATFNQIIRLENAQTGMYLLTVTEGDRKEVKKIVIK